MSKEQTIQQTDLPSLLEWKSKLAEGFCDHCKEKSLEGFVCDGCGGFGFFLCYECLGRFGREAHMHRRGSAHVFKRLEIPLCCNACLICVTPNYDKYLRCDKWMESMCFYDLCIECMKTHSNISNHTNSCGAGHKLHKVDPLRPSPLIQQPSAYTPQASEEITCTICRSRVYNDFLRCKDCYRSFDLCTRCADDGEAAKHASHEFQYLTLSHSQADIRPEPQTKRAHYNPFKNPESNR